MFRWPNTLSKTTCKRDWSIMVKINSTQNAAGFFQKNDGFLRKSGLEFGNIWNLNLWDCLFFWCDVDYVNLVQSYHLNETNSRDCICSWELMEKVIPHIKLMCLSCFFVCGEGCNEDALLESKAIFPTILPKFNAKLLPFHWQWPHPPLGVGLSVNMDLDGKIPARWYERNQCQGTYFVVFCHCDSPYPGITVILFQW